MHPFPGMPYISAPGYSFQIFELAMYLLFVLCVIHAAKKGVRDITYLMGGVCFGLLLEYVNVKSNLGYTYGKFMIMFGRAPLDIPLCIGIGWGIIMYTARLFTDTFRLPVFASAAIDTLLAISIDMSMDTVAYRLDMWHWDWKESGLDPLTANWFGIPFGNFFGWICVVFFYSSICRLLERWLKVETYPRKLRVAIIPLISMILSQVLLYVTLVYINAFLKAQFGITSKHRFITAMILLALTLLWNWRKHKPMQQAMPTVTWLVPAFAHVYFIIMLFYYNFYKESIWMVIVPVLIIIISLLIHLPHRKNGVSLRNLQPAN